MADAGFAFQTKARNLEQLKGRVEKSRILDLTYFTVRDWMDNQVECSQAVLSRFASSPMAVRSSSTAEDSFETSLAGQFESILNVPPDRKSVESAVNEVISSYRQYAAAVEDFEVLVQPMLSEVACSGVLFTRTLEHFAPYYVINYDDTTSKTDSVTSGTDDGQKCVMVRKKETYDDHLRWRDLIEAAKELERLCDCDYLDIEFAMDSRGEVYILQVRPIATGVIRQHAWVDQQTRQQLEEIKTFLDRRFERKPGLYGQTTVLGQMPDWNPAEIIGTRPKPLAYSLYRYLIMDGAWRKGRRLIGYQNPESYGLMVQIAGRPYVDVRVSFHSLLPEGLSPLLSEKLMNRYIKMLTEHPQYHDKVEFHIVHSCLDFSFRETERVLLEDGFTAAETAELRQALLRLSNNILHDRHGSLDRMRRDVEQMESRRKQWEGRIRTPQDYISAADFLLKDCMVYGTVPFSAFARCAFIGTQMMRSLQQEGVLSPQDVQQFMNSIETVAGEYTHDLQAFAEGGLTMETLCERYGHLRPGTYDITASRYDEHPELYFAPVNRSASEASEPFRMNERQRIQITELLRREGFESDAERLIEFAAFSIAMREKVKFEFTKNLSLAMMYIRQWGEYYGFSSDDMAYIPIEHLLRWNQEAMAGTFVEQCQRLVDEHKFVYQRQSQIVVSDLICSPEDLDVVQMIRHTPNFTSSSRLVAESVCLDNVTESSLERDLKGKIVMIEQADPGYDWLFSRGIGGLITKYGGVASHMAVRCSEFGIPAAIGCGEWLYQRLKQANAIELNCQEKRVVPCEGVFG